MQEILQGIEDEKLFNTVEEDLEGFGFLYYKAYEFAIKAAKFYRY